MNTPATKVYLGLSEARSLHAAIEDVTQGLGMVHLWGMLGWQDIKQRYRRSVLGPLWLTISTGIMVGTIGFLYSKIFGQPIRDYMPFLAIGFIVWNFLATTINEGCTVFFGAEAIIKQVKLPLTVHVCRVLWRNLLIFAHNAVIILLMVLIFEKGSLWPGALALAGLVLIAFNCLWIIMILGIFCARFRDIPPIIASVLQIAFFLTPILWDKAVLGIRGWFADINPFFHLIETIRAPLLGAAIPYASFGFLFLMGLLGTGLAIAAMSRFRARVPYWI